MRILLALLLTLSACSSQFNANVAARSVVTIVGLMGGGTGFVVRAPSGKAYILTNAHVCAVAVFVKSDERAFPAIVIESSTSTDLCLLDAGPLNAALPIASSEPLPHDIIHIIGNGMIMGMARTDGYYVGRIGSAILTVLNPAYGTAPILPGNSGSPVFNDQGEVVGVAYASGAQLDNRVLMVPLDEVKAFLEKR